VGDKGEWHQHGGKWHKHKGGAKHHDHKGKHHKHEGNPHKDREEEGEHTRHHHRHMGKGWKRDHDRKPRGMFSRIKSFFANMFGHGKRKHDQEQQLRHHGHEERSPRPQKLHGVHMHGLKQQQQPSEL